MSTPQQRIRTVGILALAAVPSYVLCFLWHMCVAGHMQHGPYPWYQWASDIWWVTCFAAVSALCLTFRAQRRWFFVASSILLVLLRIPLGDLMGIGAWIEVLLLGGMVHQAIMYALFPTQFEPRCEPDASPNSRPPAQLPTSPDIRTPDSQRASSSGGCG